jgi:hypothetical protein
VSFDVFARAFENGDAVTVPRAAIIDVLRPHVVIGPDEHGFCRTKSLDGGGADFYVGNDGFMVNHFSEGDTVELILRAASSHRLVLFGPGLPAMLTDARQLDHLPDSLRSLDPAPVLVTHGSEIDGLIAGDEDTYQRCRERLARG